MPKELKAEPSPEESTALVVAPGRVTFWLLCARAGVNGRMANALRVLLGRKRNETNTPCDEAAFASACASLGVTPPLARSSDG